MIEESRIHLTSSWCHDENSAWCDGFISYPTTHEVSKVTCDACLRAFLEEAEKVRARYAFLQRRF